MSRVLFVTRVVQTYREPFHRLVRDKLSSVGIDYMVAHGHAEAIHRAKNDVITLPWASIVQSRFIGLGRFKLLWQPLLRDAASYDLIIVGQENKYLLNYILQVGRGVFVKKVAMWGHGRNFQARNPSSFAERWKSYWALRCDWWFAYTHESARHITSLGFPSSKITVFNNSVDTNALRESIESVTEVDKATVRRKFGIQGTNACIFVGGLYPDKRLPFLVAAADLIREQIEDFELVIVGGGDILAELQSLAEDRPWLIIAGPQFGSEKATLMALARLFLIPGLVGLAVLDAGVAGLPIVTTAFPWHSPEIAYLRDGHTGTIVQDWQSERAYANAVIALLEDEAKRRTMASAGKELALSNSVEAMASRFAEGVVAAVASQRD